MSQNTYWVEGTTCRSCELAIERCWRTVPGVTKVVVNGATGEARLTIEGNTPPLATLQAALADTEYIVHASKGTISARSVNWMEIAGLFALVLFLGIIASRLGLFKSSISFGAGLGFGTVFVIGLLAASSSCVAVVGGLLLSSAARFNQRYSATTKIGRMRPVVLFVLGRSVGYTILGGMLGVFGAVLTPAPWVTALIMIVAASFMIIMGLDMLHIAPAWMKGLLPRLPKRFAHRIVDMQEKEHWTVPFLLGAGTFFLPCGFTQALQLYALTTHSFWAGASVLLAFSLGTAPALLALGFVSNSVKGAAGRWFFKFSGALVVVLGLWNIQNGLALAGFVVPATNVDAASAVSNGVVVENGVQVVKMNVGISGYSPNHFTVKAAMPVRWEITAGRGAGCASVLVSRQMNIQKFLEAGLNTISFTPTGSGEIAFSCSMGMYRGSFTVVP